MDFWMESCQKILSVLGVHDKFLEKTFVFSMTALHQKDTF